MNKRTSFFKAVSLSLIASILGSSLALAQSPQLTPDQQKVLEPAIQSEFVKLGKFSDEKVIAEFEALSAVFYGPDSQALVKINPATATDAQKQSVARLFVRYNALNRKVAAIPHAKEQVYLKLFGDRKNSPYYGAVSQDEFDDGMLLFIGIFAGVPLGIVVIVSVIGAWRSDD